MRIKVINPNTSSQMSDTIYNAVKDCGEKSTEIIMATSKWGPDSIECYYDEYLAIPGLLKEIKIGDQKEDVDAYIIACFDDPGINAAREITSKPVIGIAEAAVATIRMLAPCFSVVSVSDRSLHMTRKLIRHLGAEKECCSIRSTGMSVLEYESRPEKGLEALDRESRKAIELDGAEGILLGCAGFVDFAKKLRDKLGVPVIEGVSPAIKIAELIVSLGLKTSKKLSYSFPVKKRIDGYDGFFME